MITLSIISTSDNPAFNLAAEEYLLKKRTENINFLYINSPSVIIGKHQNALAEINLTYLEDNNIPLFRRLSGGGSVYHDSGNINYCFIKTGKPTELVDFKKATKPVVEVIKNWGVNVYNGRRNDLLVNHQKISGNACHVFKTRVMHHGTLLYCSNLDMLTSSLKNNPLGFTSKAIKSVRSQVTNLKPLLNNGWSNLDFITNLEARLRELIPESVSHGLSTDDKNAIEKLIIEKYGQWEWNYGYGPAYTFKKRVQVGEHQIMVNVSVARGKISSIDVVTNSINPVITEELALAITGSDHEKNNLLEILRGLSSRFPTMPRAEEMINLFF